MPTPASAQLPANRSIPSDPVIPVLHYPDVLQAVEWLCRAFGFTERLRIGTHRVQLNVSAGGGAVVVADGAAPGSEGADRTHSVMIRITAIDEHFEAASLAGATIISPPTTHPYGERQYSALDPGGHAWTFSQTVANVEPSSWGGILVSEGPNAS